MAIKIELDVWGWYCIKYKRETLQAFRTEKECRQWISDCTPMLRIKGIL